MTTCVRVALDTYTVQCSVLKLRVKLTVSCKERPYCIITGRPKVRELDEFAYPAQQYVVVERIWSPPITVCNSVVKWCNSGDIDTS